MEIEQQKLDQDHQKFLSEKEAQVLSEKEQVATVLCCIDWLRAARCVPEKEVRESQERSRSKG